MRISKLVKSLFLIVVIIFFATSFAYSQQQEISIREAKTAFNHFELRRSMEIYSKVASSKSAKAKDKVEALQNLALQEWTFFHNYKKSNQTLKSALLFNNAKSKTYSFLGQINLEASEFQKALQYADISIAESTTETEKIAASLLKAQIIHDESITVINKGHTPNKNKLLLATDLLKYVLKKQPGNPIPAELLLGVSLLQKNGKDLLKAWKSYYLITDENKINQVLQPAFNILNSILPEWNDRELSSDDRINLIKALAGSNFYNYASLIATCKQFGEPIPIQVLDNTGIRQVLRFNDFIEGIKKVNDLYYPKLAKGLQNYSSNYATEISVVAKRLWVELSTQNTNVNYKEEDFLTLIKAKFGALGYIGTTNGYFSMLLGLIIHDETKEVNQYGYKADFRYISISRLISKDFTTWYGAANVGGWGTDSSMVQVRDAYLQAPFTRLSWVTDTTAYSQIVNKIEEAKVSDIEKCKQSIYAEPLFLSLYFKLKASESLFDSLKLTGLKDEELYITFIAETMRLNIESTVFAHEGRHAIDQLFFKQEFDTLSHDERELRAKFSEIIFSSNPKLALTGSILGGELTELTPHGKANLRLMKIIVSWMQLHNNEIEKIDTKLPLLMQLDLLSSQQLEKFA